MKPFVTKIEGKEEMLKLLKTYPSVRDYVEQDGKAYWKGPEEAEPVYMAILDGSAKMKEKHFMLDTRLANEEKVQKLWFYLKETGHEIDPFIKGWEWDAPGIEEKAYDVLFTASPEAKEISNSIVLPQSDAQPQQMSQQHLPDWMNAHEASPPASVPFYENRYVRLKLKGAPDSSPPAPVPFSQPQKFPWLGIFAQGRLYQLTAQPPEQPAVPTQAQPQTQNGTVHDAQIIQPPRFSSEQAQKFGSGKPLAGAIIGGITGFITGIPLGDYLGILSWKDAVEQATKKVEAAYKEYESSSSYWLHTSAQEDYESAVKNLNDISTHPEHYTVPVMTLTMVILSIAFLSIGWYVGHRLRCDEIRRAGYEYKPKACAIATAAYGTPLCEELDTLREFRDKKLVTDPFGLALTDTYYQVSPPIARVMEKSPRLRNLLRKVVAEPAVKFVRMSNETNS